jgi:hypothetical protein
MVSNEVEIDWLIDWLIDWFIMIFGLWPSSFFTYTLQDYGLSNTIIYSKLRILIKN